MALLRAIALGLTGFALVFMTQPVLAQGAPDAEFRNGVNAFEQGRFEDAEKHFRNVLKSKPDHTQALRYRDEAGYHFWVKVLARGGRLATVAKRVLKAAEKAAIRERLDEDQLRTDMKGLWSDDFREEVETIEKLIAKYGHHVVPELVETLSDRHADEKRVRVIQLLSRLGDEGTLAVIELLEADDIVLSQNAAVALGHTRDIRAIPPLQKLIAKAKDPHVKEAAAASIKKIKGPSFDAPEFFARVSEAFYKENPLFTVNRYKEYVVWKWKDNKLHRRLVPKFRWNEEVAEEYAYDGLSVAPDNQILWTNLLNTYAQEWSEIEQTLRVATMLTARGAEVDDTEIEKMKSMQKEMVKVKALVASAGADRILAALGKAMADQRAPVAVFLIERLQDINIDASVLEGGGEVKYLPAAERDKDAAPAPRRTEPKPKRTEPKPKRTEPKPTKRPEPRKVGDDDDDGAPKLDGDDDDDGAPKLDGDDDDGGEKPKKPKRRRPRKVSQAPAATPGSYASSCAVRTSQQALLARMATAPRKSLAKAAKAAPRMAAPAPRALAKGAEKRVTKLGFRGLGMAKESEAKGALSGGSSEKIMTGGKAISAALAYGDKRVRYAAAIALAHLNPAGEFSNAGKVMENLVDALGESGQRVVLVVERDRHNRNRLVGLLRELGFMTFGVEKGLDGLARAKAFPSQDMIVVSTELNPKGLGIDPIEFQFIDSLREDYRTKHIKVMVLTPEERVSTMQTLVDSGKAVDVLTPEVDKATLNDKMKKAFGSAEDQQDEKARSDKIAERAALAIASLKRGHTQFDIKAAAAALAKNVRQDAGRPDNVRLACLKALASIGPDAKSEALDTLVREFKNSTNSIEVRRMIPFAMGEVIKNADTPGEVFQVLKNALKQDDQQLWTNSFHALGKGNLTGAQALEVFNEQRQE